MKKFFFYNLGFFFSILIAFFVCEILSRIFFGGVFRNDPVLQRNTENGLTYKASQISEFISFEWDVMIKINSKGFRDSEDIYKNNEEKVLILGDSFTEGFGISQEKTFPKMLQQMLKDNGKKISVLNAGITGNNLVDYLEIYYNYFQSDPKIETIIIALFVGNDLTDNYNLRKVQDLQKKKKIFVIKNFAARNSTLYNIINRFIKSNIEIRTIFTKFGFMKERKGLLSNYDIKNTLLDKKVKFSTDLIIDLKKKIKNKKILVTIIPSKEQIDDEYWKLLNQTQKNKNSILDRNLPTRLIENQLKKYQVDTINFNTKFNLIKNNNIPIYFKYDPHTNEYGHEIMALEIFKKIEKSFESREKN